jgi:hypothetical protein
VQNITENDLKKRLDSTRRDLSLGKVGVVFLVIWALAFSIYLFEPFGWFEGTPAVHEAKKWILLSIIFIWIPSFAGVWFLIIRPLRTGVTGGSRGKFQMPYVVLRSERPRRFRIELWCNVIIIIGGFTIGVWTLNGFIHDLQKAKTGQSQGNGETRTGQ